MTGPSHTPNLPPSLMEIRRLRKPIRDVNAEHEQDLGRLDRLALALTERVGTMGFFLVIVTWTVLWLGWNLLAPRRLQFDPPTSFAFWLFISNLIQIFLMPLIMVGQNLQGRHSEKRAENDYEINVKAEQEVDVLLHQMEYQNALLEALLTKAGMTPAEALSLPPGDQRPSGRGSDKG